MQYKGAKTNLSKQNLLTKQMICRQKKLSKNKWFVNKTKDVSKTNGLSTKQRLSTKQIVCQQNKWFEDLRKIPCFKLSCGSRNGSECEDERKAKEFPQSS